MLLLAAPSPARAEAPSERMAVLARGVNIAHWLRFPVRSDNAALRDYLDDAEVMSLKQAGFTYARLAVGLEVVMTGRHIQPDKLAVVVAVIRRLQHAGLGVMIDPHPQQIEHWDFRHDAGARQNLLGFWNDLAPALAALPVGLTFPEVVNEPTDDAGDWDRFQQQVLQVIRAALPQNTVALTGTNWSSINGLLLVQPVADTNVVYTFHDYEPTLLTLLGLWDPGINQAELGANLPFPVTDATCRSALAAIGDEHTRSFVRYWCSQPINEATIAADLQRATDWGRRHGVSVAMTEFGATSGLRQSTRTAYFAAIRHATDAQHLPWALWSLDDHTGFGRPVGGSAAAFRLSPDILTPLGVGR